MTRCADQAGLDLAGATGHRQLDLYRFDDGHESTIDSRVIPTRYSLSRTEQASLRASVGIR